MNPFATLGVPERYEIDLPSLEKTHRELSRALHPDKYAGSGASERRDSLTKAVAVNEAFRVLRDPIARAEALFRLRGIAVGETVEPKPDPEFLMEMLEQREALQDARAEGDRAKLRALVESIERSADAAERALAEGFSAGANADLVKKLGELRFFHRFLEEASAIEDAFNEDSPS